MLNLTVIGNLTADPEQRMTQSGKTVVSFTVAESNPRDKEHPAFVRVTAWEKLGEICCKYLSKGKKVFVSGRPAAHGYKNRNGDAAASLELTAQDIEFLSSAAQAQQEAHQQAPQQTAAPKPQQVDMMPGFTYSDEDLPF